MGIEATSINAEGDVVGGDKVAGDVVGRDKLVDEPPEAKSGSRGRSVVWGFVVFAAVQLTAGVVLAAIGVEVPGAYWEAFRAVVGAAIGGAAVRVAG